MSAACNGLLDDLNVPQREAVEHEGGPLLVLAGPGTGKTRVITRRIAYRVLTGQVDPQRILALTFTNRAAGEMKRRVGDILGEDHEVRAGTFHWACHAILRRHGRQLGLPPDFRLLTPGEARAHLRQAACHCQACKPLSTLASAVSFVKGGIPLQRSAARHGLAPERLTDVCQSYASELRAAGSLDLDDLVFLSVRLLTESDHIRERCRRSFDDILVDEYQDVSPIQHQLVAALVPASGRLVVVGDDDQAIYGWRAADVESMLRFRDDFPSATLIALNQTYRSTKRILRAAQTLVAQNSRRFDKSLTTARPAGAKVTCFLAADEMDEAEWIAQEIAGLRYTTGRLWADFAVLYRVNAQSRALEDALVRRGLPYHIHSGQRFYDRPEVRRVTAYLRLALEPSDWSAAAFLLSSMPGIGRRRLEAIAGAWHESGSLEVALYCNEVRTHLPAPVLARLEDLASRLNHLHSRRTESLGSLIDLSVYITLEDAAVGTLGDVETVEENLGELRSIATTFTGARATTRDFLDRVVLSGSDAQPADSITLMSLHASKGLEYQVVFVTGLEEGLLPHRKALDEEAAVEEERRLCYVGMTRARELLYLSYAHSRLLGGQALIGIASRFLHEIGSDHLTLRSSGRYRVKPRLYRVRPGERVLHPRWKAGTVTAVEGAGRETMVTIQFDGVGKQRLQLCHAPLSRGSSGAHDAAG